MTGRHTVEDVLGLFERTAGGDPDVLVPWGIGRATEDDVRTAATAAAADGLVRTAWPPWTAEDANVIRDYLVGIVQSRRPQFRVASVAESDASEGWRWRLAIVFDEDGAEDNFDVAARRFRLWVSHEGRLIPRRVPGLGRAAVAREAARLGVSKRTLQRRRKALRERGINPDNGSNL